MIEVRPIVSRDEWLEWRREVLTASDIGAVAGVDSYRTPLQVYAEKMTGFNPAENEMMRRGRHAELMAIEYLRENHPDWTIERPGKFWIDVDLHLGGTPDALATDDKGLKVNVQIKTIARPVFESWGGEPPPGYLYQVTCENMLVGADYGILVVLVLSAYRADLHEFVVPRHPAAEKRICEIAREFWQNMEDGVIPQPNYEQDEELVKAMFPPDEDKPSPIDLSDNNRIREILEEYAGLKESHATADKELKLLDKQIKGLNAEIAHILDGAELATVDDWIVTYKTVHRKEYTVQPTSYSMVKVRKKKPTEEDEEEAA